jgi:hypothetical protein
MALESSLLKFVLGAGGVVFTILVLVFQSYTNINVCDLRELVVEVAKQSNASLDSGPGTLSLRD